MKLTGIGNGLKERVDKDEKELANNESTERNVGKEPYMKMDKVFKIGILVLGAAFLGLCFVAEYKQQSDGKSLVANTDDGILAIIMSVTSPLQLFTLIILIGITTFARHVVEHKESDLYKYCIHMFLAIIGAITMIALWSPQSFYRPADWENRFDGSKWYCTALPPTIFFAIIGGLYFFYQYYLPEKKSKTICEEWLKLRSENKTELSMEEYYMREQKRQ